METAEIEINRNRFKSGIALIKPLLQCCGIELINYSINRLEAEMLIDASSASNIDIKFERIARLGW